MSPVRTPGGLAFLVLLAGLLGCPRQTGVEEGPASRVGEPVGPDTVTGMIRQVGNVPFTRVIIQAGDEEGREAGSATLTGEYEEELARLAGARVRVVGERVEGGGPGPRMRVSSYEILDVDGDRPYVGILREEDGGHYLETTAGGRVPLGALSLRLRSMVGGRVWVVLSEGGTVQRYGILREPEELQGTE